MAPSAGLVERLAIVASPPAPSTTAYPSAVLLAFFSLLTVLLIIPPMCWHYRNRNLGATLLVAWTIIMNLQSFINAITWSSDDIISWYDGAGLCDVEAKLQIAWGVAAPAALACVLRALANAMNTDRATLIKGKAQRWRDYAIDLSWCICAPLLQMLFHYVVQYRRYYLFGISGCVPAADQSWLTVLLLYIPPVIWTLIDGYFALLILARLYRYRLTFASILASSNTTKCRFMRLYILCLVWILVFIPTQAYVLYVNLSTHRTSYSWSEAHDFADWDNIIMTPSYGAIIFDRWIWLGSGVVTFIFFGLGREAVSMYRSGLLAIGVGRIFPSLRPDYMSRKSTAGTTPRPLERLQMVVPASPKNMTFLETITKDRDASKKSQNANLEKATMPTGRQSVVSSMLSTFKSKKVSSQRDSEGFYLETSGEPLTVRSAVSAGVVSPVASQHSLTNSIEITVRKEVRQGSETAETLPAKAYEST